METTCYDLMEMHSQLLYVALSLVPISLIIGIYIGYYVSKFLNKCAKQSSDQSPPERKDPNR